MSTESRIRDLETALALAVDALEEFYGCDADDSSTLKYLRMVLNGEKR